MAMIDDSQPGASLSEIMIQKLSLTFCSIALLLIKLHTAKTVRNIPLPHYTK